MIHIHDQIFISVLILGSQYFTNAYDDASQDSEKGEDMTAKDHSYKVADG